MLPRNVVVVLLDSLNRHMLGSYGGQEFDTPELDRFARARDPVHTAPHRLAAVHPGPPRHPVRRARLPVATVGIDRGVGGLDRPPPPPERGHHDAADRPSAPVRGRRRELPHRLRRVGLRARPRERSVAHPRRPVLDGRARACRPPPGSSPTTTTSSRTWFRDESDFPGPRTMAAAARWLEHEAPTDEPFFLLVDEFDPHEPFDTPEPWASRYFDAGDEPRLDLAAVRRERRRARRPRRGLGPADPRELRLQALDDRPLVRSHHRRARPHRSLGRHRGDRVHRPRPLPRREGHLGQARRPGVRAARPHPAARRVARSTGRRASTASRPRSTSSPRSPTSSASTVPQRTHGHSLVPVLEGAEATVRDFALTGVWGREVHVTDGHRKYARGTGEVERAVGDVVEPLVDDAGAAFPELRLPRPDRRARLDFMPGSDVPVIRQPFAAGRPAPVLGDGPTRGPPAVRPRRGS